LIMRVLSALITLCSISVLARMPEKRAPGNAWMDYFTESQGQWLNKVGADQMMNEMSAVYNLFSGNNERENRRNHSERGAMRSGEGTPDQQALRQQQFDDRQRMEDMEAAGEYATDRRTARQQLEYREEQARNRRGPEHDDRFDLIPEDSVLITEDISFAETEQRAGGRQLSTINDQGELVIHRLDEPYPTECYNHGQMAK